MRKVKVLFVCLGNICRSPLAEAIFKDKISKKGFQSLIEADSCGTGNYHIGQQPDDRTLSNAIKNGIEIDHCCRQLRDSDLEYFDYVMAMDASNYQNILRLPSAKKHKDKIALMRHYDPLAKGADVPDPYFGGEKGFQDVFEMLDRTMDHFIEHLESNHLKSTKV